MKLKHVITILLVAICLFIAPAQATQMSVEPVHHEVVQGDNITIDIKVYPEESAVYGASYTLHFDNTLLHATTQAKGPFLTHDNATSNIYKDEIDNTIGEIIYAEARTGATAGVTDPGVLATITFQVIGEGGVSSLNIMDLEGELLYSLSGSIPTDINNGSVEILMPSATFLIQGYIFYENGTPCNNSSVNITNLNRSKEWAAATNESSNYYWIMLSSGADLITGETLQFNVESPDGCQSNITEHIITQTEVDAGGFEYDIMLEFRPGDVNGDGKITSADAAIVLQMVVRGEYNFIADVNHDDSVTSLDALMIMQAAVGHITFNR